MTVMKYKNILKLVTDYFSAISSDEDEEFFELPPENGKQSFSRSVENGLPASQHDTHAKHKTSGMKTFVVKQF